MHAPLPEGRRARRPAPLTETRRVDLGQLRAMFVILSERAPRAPPHPADDGIGSGRNESPTAARAFVVILTTGASATGGTDLRQRGESAAGSGFEIARRSSSSQLSLRPRISGSRGSSVISLTGVQIRLLARLAALGFAPRRGIFDWAGLPMLPYFDRRAAETPRTADTEAGYSPLAQQAVNRSWMDSKVRRQLRDGENIFRRCHCNANLPIPEIGRFPF